VRDAEIKTNEMLSPDPRNWGAFPHTGPTRAASHPAL